MSAKKITNPHILIMKAGPYCDYSLEEIIKIKQDETLKCGRFFWGYGGVFCRPNRIHSFIIHAKAHNSKPVVLFSITKSAYNTPQKGRFTHFSSEKSKWEKLPKEVLLVGDKTRSHFAIVAKNLKPIDKTLNLGEYCSYAGMFPDPNKYLDSYLKYRVDKACGYYLPRQGTEKRDISIQYSGELVEPYSVYIK